MTRRFNTYVKDKDKLHLKESTHIITKYQSSLDFDYARFCTTVFYFQFFKSETLGIGTIRINNLALKNIQLIDLYVC